MSRRTAATRARSNPNVTSPFVTAGVTAKRVTVRSITTGTLAETFDLPLDAVSTSWKCPSGMLVAVSVNDCFPGSCRCVYSVATSAPPALRRVAVTVAAAVRLYEMRVVCVIVRGVAASDLIASATGVVPTKPVAGRTSGPGEIVHVYDDCGAVDASHVQSMTSLVPVPVATTPSEPLTVTLHGSGVLSRAWKRTSPPSWP